MALYEIVVYGELAGQLIVNRFHYRSDEVVGSGSHAEALAEEFGLSIDQVPPVAGTVIGDWASLISNQYSFDEFIVRDLYSNTNFFAAPFVPALSGTASAQVNSPLIAFGMSTNRVRTDIRRGQKRFAGVPEDGSDSGGLVASTYVGYLETLAESMSEVLVWTEGEVTVNFTPVILGLERHEADPPEHPVPYYTYYETETAQLDHVASGLIWTPKLQVRSQVSRQYGRGR